MTDANASSRIVRNFPQAKETFPRIAGREATPTLSDVNSGEGQAQPCRVVVVGGGVAALEGVMALRSLAGDRVSITLLSPESEFFYRPLSVREPFAYPPAEHYPLAPFAEQFGVELHQDAFGWVKAHERLLGTEGGQELSYDALLLGLGAHTHPAFKGVLTIDDRRMDELLHGVVQDIEEGYTKRVVFIAPPSAAWPLPLYELALMAGQRAYDMSAQVDFHLITTEEAPLAIFGQGASEAVSRLLTAHSIAVHTSSYAKVESRRVTLLPNERHIDDARVIALPLLKGPSVRGLPAGDQGFIPVTPYGQVRGVDRVFAAGDAIDFPIKHGGLAAQQADVAAESIAALAGADVTPRKFHPKIRGILLTGREPRYLSAQITGGAGFSSEVSDTSPWSPPEKISAEHLSPYLAQQRAAGATRSQP
jgi:sulfide:quinone oxidoreductase